MDFVFAMSIFSSAADISCEKGKAQEWIRSWVVAPRNDGKGAEQGNPQQQQNNGPRARVQRAPREEVEVEKKKQPPRVRPCFAPEFDGINCFETFVSH